MFSNQNKLVYSERRLKKRTWPDVLDGSLKFGERLRAKPKYKLVDS